MKILDSNIWIAFFYISDANNTHATDMIRILMDADDDIYFTDYIILEVSTILLQKAGKDIADGFLDFVKNASNVRIIYTSELLFKKYIDFFVENNYEKLSFIDQSLMYLSRDFEIVTFDKQLQKSL